MGSRMGLQTLSGFGCTELLGLTCQETEMPKAAIAIDNWKFPIFERHLQQAGYSFVRADGLTADAMVLSVTTENLVALGEVVKAANTEAARTGAPQ
jgi:hypothetical protein